MKIKQTVWQVAIRDKNDTCDFFKSNKVFLAIPNPFGCWAADPFIIEEDGKVYIFAELFNVLKWKADVAYCIYEKGKFSRWQTIISEAHHFSFPYIFKYNNEFYIMPETGKVNELSLYKAVEFPGKWQKVHILSQEGNFADSVFVDDDRILTYYNKEKVLNIALLLRKNDRFYLAEYKEDVNSDLRPAGKIFNMNGETIRPTQEGKRFYGEAIIFNKLSFSSNNALPKEEPIFKLEAKDISVSRKNNYKITGIHTYNFSENYEVIDFQYNRFNLLDIIKRLQLKLKK